MAAIHPLLQAYRADLNGRYDIPFAVTKCTKDMTQEGIHELQQVVSTRRSDNVLTRIGDILQDPKNWKPDTKRQRDVVNRELRQVKARTCSSSSSSSSSGGDDDQQQQQPPPPFMGPRPDNPKWCHYCESEMNLDPKNNARSLFHFRDKPECSLCEQTSTRPLGKCIYLYDKVGGTCSYICGDCVEQRKEQVQELQKQRRENVVVKFRRLAHEDDEDVTEPMVNCKKCTAIIHRRCALDTVTPEGCLLCRPTPVHNIQSRAQKLPCFSDVEKYMQRWMDSHLKDVPEDERNGARFVIKEQARNEVTVHVHEAFRKRAPNFPNHFPCTTAAYCLYQVKHGYDLLVFIMYVKEYDGHCPPPNRHRVQISYLDSLNYVQPFTFRKRVYQSFIRAYLESARIRGFEHAHIWSCPPHDYEKCPEYVFVSRPQKVYSSRPDWIIPPHKLREYYEQIFETMLRSGSVQNKTTFAHKYLKGKPWDKDPQQWPYVELDFWTSPNTVKKLETPQKDLCKQLLDPELDMKSHYILTFSKSLSVPQVTTNTVSNACLNDKDDFRRFMQRHGLHMSTVRAAHYSTYYILRNSSRIELSPFTEP